MPISVECPACEHEFRVPNSYAGKEGKCPECGKVFIAESTNSASPSPTSRVRPPEPPALELGRVVPVPPPQQLADRTNGTALAEPPAIMEGAPPVTEDLIVSTRPTPPPRTESDNGGPTKQPSRSKSTPLWVALGVLSVMLAVCVILLVKNMRLEGKEVVGDTERDHRATATETDKNLEESAAAPPVEAAAIPDNVEDVQLNQLWDEAQPAVFRVFADDGEQVLTGLAFAVDERGWLATSFQLIEDAKSVHVAGVNDPPSAGLPAKGVVAASPEHNVALIAIDGAPGAILSLDSSQPKAGQNVAVWCVSADHEVELASGTFQRLRMFDDLTPNSRAIAHQRGLSDSPDLKWLEHDLPLELIDRGGPLLDTEGKVIGINTTLSPDSKTGFALPVEYLIGLIDSAGDEVTPFAPGSELLATNAAPGLEPGVAPEIGPGGGDPKPPERPKPGTLDSVDLIRELHATCKDIDWQPQTIGEYELFQELAEHVHVAKVNESNELIEEGLRILIAAPAQEVLVELSKTPWPDEPAMKMLNALASEGLNEEGKGIVCYVEVASPAGDAVSVDGTPALVCDLIGTERSIVVPVAKESRLLRRKTRWLLVGVHDPSQIVERPLVEGGVAEMPLVRAKNLLGEPKLKEPEKAPAARRGRRNTR